MPLVDLNVEEPGWTDIPLADLCEISAAAAISAAGHSPEDFEISILACGDDRIAELNRAFRGAAVPTNVLAWPASDLSSELPGGTPKQPLHNGHSTPCFLGDVAISLQKTRSEAVDRAIPLKNHVSHLILHGCLHLLGFDHETEADADVMEGLEVDALGKLGIDNPYE